MTSWLLPKLRFNEFLGRLAELGYEVLGPKLEDGAIVYAPIQNSKDLPVGWRDRQSPGVYRIERRDDEKYFGYAVGPHSWKKYLFPPSQKLWEARTTPNGFEIIQTAPDPPRRAFVGVRGCELQALAVQDRVFLGRDGRFTDPHYAKARERLFLVAVECQDAAETCFCTSMQTGPAIPQSSKTTLPFDLVLTELQESFVVRSGSDLGLRVVTAMNLAAATVENQTEAQSRVEAAAKEIQRTVETSNIREMLHENQEHPRWDEVATRCLACTNCTMVCPTCFCSSVTDHTDLSLEHAERHRQWDSCFNPEFAYVHGGNFRPTIRGRYRQWLTHKFASWLDQFDISGCVGCGRCITWCPVGIDVTEELAELRKEPSLSEEVPK